MIDDRIGVLYEPVLNEFCELIDSIMKKTNCDLEEANHIVYQMLVLNQVMLESEVGKEALKAFQHNYKKMKIKQRHKERNRKN